VLYLDEAKAIPGKGFDSEFGFHRNRPFYFRSRLPMKRVAQAQGNNNISQMRWKKANKAQQWTFDPVSKTIKNFYWKNYCMEIPSSGNAN
jgi:hypothetical protein